MKTPPISLSLLICFYSKTWDVIKNHCDLSMIYLKQNQLKTSGQLQQRSTILHTHMAKSSRLFDQGQSLVLIEEMCKLDEGRRWCGDHQLISQVSGRQFNSEECSGILWNDLMVASAIALPLVDCRPQLRHRNFSPTTPGTLHKVFTLLG